MEKQRRVMLKLSGEALAGEKKTGFDEEVVKDVARQVKLSVDQGVQVAIVIGGGNFWRGRSSNAIDRPKADQIGMLATVMNCIYVSEIFRTTGMKTEIFTPFACSTFTKLFSKDAANEALAQGKVVFFAGGTGHPYFSTDTGVVLRAWSYLCLSEGAQLIINTYPQEIQESMREMRPTCMCSVPRFWEKVYIAVKAKMDDAGHC